MAEEPRAPAGGARGETTKLAVDGLDQRIDRPRDRRLVAREQLRDVEAYRSLVVTAPL
jgi:hypothetical protein